MNATKGNISNDNANNSNATNDENSNNNTNSSSIDHIVAANRAESIKNITREDNNKEGRK